MDKIFDEPIFITDTFDVHQDWEVPIPGFFIIASKDGNKRSVMDFSDQEIGELGGVLKKIRHAMKEVLDINTAYIFQNEDTEHGFHIWMFPRHAWMDEFGKKIQSVKPIMEYAKVHNTSPAHLNEVKAAARKVAAYLKT